MLSIDCLNPKFTFSTCFWSELKAGFFSSYVSFIRIYRACYFSGILCRRLFSIVYAWSKPTIMTFSIVRLVIGAFFTFIYVVELLRLSFAFFVTSFVEILKKSLEVLCSTSPFWNRLVYNKFKKKFISSINKKRNL